MTQLIKRVEDVVRTPGPLFRYTTTIKKMFANTTSSAAMAVQHVVVDHGRCVSFWWCCCGLLFFLSLCVSNLNPALCFSLDCGTDFDRKKKRTHTHARRSLPLGKRAPRIGSTNAPSFFTFFDPSLSCCALFRRDFFERVKNFGSLRVIIQLY